MKDNSHVKTVSWKTKIYLAYEMIIQKNLIGQYSYSILLIITTTQLLYFPIAYIQSNDDAYYYLEAFFKVATIVPYILEDLNSNYFLLTWILLGSLLLLSYILLLHNIILNESSEKKTYSKVTIFSSHLLSILLVFEKTILIIPSSFAFSIPIFDSTYFTWWKGTNLIISILSFFALILELGLLKMAEMFSDSYIQSTLSWACMPSQFFIILYFFQFGLGMYLAIDQKMAGGLYSFPIIAIFLLYMLYSYYTGLSIYNSLINAIQFIQVSVLFSCIIGMYIGKMMGVIAYIDMGIINIFLGIVFGFLLSDLQKNRVANLLNSEIRLLASEKDSINALILLSQLPEASAKHKKALTMLIGVLNIHSENCTKDDCVCRVIRISLKESRGENGVIKLQKMTARGSSLQLADEFLMKKSKKSLIDLWFELIEEIIEQLLEKHTSSVNLQLFASYFQHRNIENYYKGLFQLIKAQDMDYNLAQDFAIFRMKVLLDKEIINEETSKTKNIIDLDLNILANFEEKRLEFETSLRNCTEKVIQFWNLLLSAEIKIENVYDLGCQITSFLKSIHETFNSIVSIFPNHIKTFSTYAFFLKNVTNSEMESEEYSEKVAQIRRNHEIGKKEIYENNSGFSINGDTAIILISGNIETLGVILNANEHTQNFFGYSYNDLVGISVNKLMPKIVSAAHDKFLLKFYEKGQNILINNEKLLFGISKSGLLIPIALLVKTMPGLMNEIRYIGFIRSKNTYKKYLNLPPEYNRIRNINTILAEINGNIIAISENTAKILNIPVKYFEAKKEGLLNKPLNIRDLNKQLDSSENLDELNNGTIIDLKLKKFNKNIDKDFLTAEEEEALKNSPENMKVFMQKMSQEFPEDVKYNIFTFIRKDIEETIEFDEKIDEKKKILQEFRLETLRETASSPSSSLFSENDKIKAIAVELKKNIVEQKDTKQIILVKRGIFVTLLIFFGISLADLVTYMIYLTNVYNFLLLNETSNLRRNYFTTMIEQFESYRDLALGIEQNTSNFESNRYASLQTDIQSSLIMVKDNEYAFQEQLDTNPINSISAIYLTPGVNVMEIYIDSNISFTNQGLGNTIMEIIAKTSRLINEDPENSLNNPFFENIFSYPIEQTYTLTQTEKDGYFILTNGLYNILNASSDILIEITNSFDETNNDEDKMMTILHSVRWAIIGIILIVSIPIIRKVQNGKTGIFKIFGEVPKNVIEALLKECKVFYENQMDLLRIENQEKEYLQKKEAIYTQCEALNNPTTTENINNTKPVSTNLEDSQDLINPLAKKLENRINLDEDTPQEKEGNLHEERKRQFREYKANIGSVFLILLLSMSTITAYQSGIFVFQKAQNSLIEDNWDYINVLQNRWFFFGATLVYYMSATPTNEPRMSETNQSSFLYYMDSVTEIEDEIDDSQSDYPSNQIDVETEIKDIVEQSYCGFLLQNNVINQSRFNDTWCNSIGNGILQSGIKATIYFLLNDLQSRYNNLATGKLANDTTFLEDKLIYENILVPTFLYIANNGSQRGYQLIDSTMMKTAILYTGFFFLNLVILLVLLAFFAGKLNTELWNALGIISLLPLVLVSKKPSIKVLFCEQMNINIE